MPAGFAVTPFSRPFLTLFYPTLSLQREIKQCEATIQRFSELRMRPAPADAGLEDLTEEQLQLAADALGPGPGSQVLASKSFKGVCRCPASSAMDL